MAHHDSQPRKALDETVEFARAIELARTLTNEEETLIVVSSDHSHVFTYNGYPWRHRDVLGLVDPSLGEDDLPFETLSYANGPGYEKTYTEFGRADLSNDDFTELNRQHTSGVPLDSESHAGEDVGIYANGPWAHLFQGSKKMFNQISKNNLKRL
jgi:alkaline phosphatase